MTATAEAYGFGARAPYAQFRESEYDMKERVRLSGLFPRVRNQSMFVQLQALLKELALGFLGVAHAAQQTQAAAAFCYWRVVVDFPLAKLIVAPRAHALLPFHQMLFLLFADGRSLAHKHCVDKAVSK